MKCEHPKHGRWTNRATAWQAQHVVCTYCAAWLSLGEANDAGEHAAQVAVEKRAAEIAGDPTSLSHEVQVSTFEHYGFVGEECAMSRPGTQIILIGMRSWQAGYLARCIAEHNEAP